MSDDRFDQELSRALRDETTAASPGFTGRVLSRVDRRPEPTLWLGRPVLAGAAAILLLVVGIVLGLQFGAPGGSGRVVADEREQLRLEYLELQRELEQIRELASQSDPVLYLGGDETLDMVYDLSRYEERFPGAGFRPASLPQDRG